MVAHEWDKDIKSPAHFVNFEDGYKKFESFEAKVLKNIGLQEAGIDIGCGTAASSLKLAKHVKKLYLLDISNKMLQIAKRKYPKAKILYASGTNIPLDGESVDIVTNRGILISLLAHKKEINALLNEIYRILKPNGVLILDFLSNKKSVKFKKKESYKKSFTRSEMSRLLKARKFHKIMFDGTEGARVVRVCALKSE